MAVTNPPLALQNLSTHTAELLRIGLTSDQGAPRAAASLVPRGGVHPFLGGMLAVTQQGSPTMGITVATGIVTVPGTEGGSQGAYTCLAASTTNVAIAAAHASLPRIDLIVARVQDAAYSGATNAWSLEAVTGTAAGSPSAPTAPNNSIVLAQVAVAAAATQILNANITDRRFFMSTGVTPAPSATMPSPAVANMLVTETDTGLLKRYNGSSWDLVNNPGWQNYTPTFYTTSSTTPTPIAASIVHARYWKVGTTCKVMVNANLGATTTGGCSMSLPFTPAQRWLILGSGAICGSGVTSPQGGFARCLASPHTDKVIIATLANLFIDSPASSGIAFNCAIEYETV